MAKSASSTIILRGTGIQKEAVANAAITPGHLVRLRSDGNIEVMGTAAATGGVQKAFAKENEVVGKGIDDAYAASDNCIYSVMYPGSEVYALIADGVTTTVAGALESAADGTLKPVTTGDPVAIALEAVTASGAAARVRVAVL